VHGGVLQIFRREGQRDWEVGPGGYGGDAQDRCGVHAEGAGIFWGSCVLVVEYVFISILDVMLAGDWSALWRVWVNEGIEKR